MSIKQLFIHAMLAGLIGLFSLSASAEVSIDQPAPVFAATTASGAKFNLESLKGKTVVLEWSNHECPFVKKHYESGNIPQLQKEALAKNIAWVQIISSAPGKQGYVNGAEALKLNEARGAKPAYVLLDSDGKVGQLYGAQTTPHLFIIDAKGVLVYKGGIDDIATPKKEDLAKANNYIREAWAALADGKKVPHASTQPYGCSIKYAS